MDTALRQLLTEMEIWGSENDAVTRERRDRMLNLEPDTAHLISILVRSSRCKSLLEIGTSNGYSTIWLAWTTQATGGHMMSIEREEAKQKMADMNLRRVGLRDRVDLLLASMDFSVNRTFRSDRSAICPGRGTNLCLRSCLNRAFWWSVDTA